jgi:hypothetical protein
MILKKCEPQAAEKYRDFRADFKAMKNFNFPINVNAIGNGNIAGFVTFALSLQKIPVYHSGAAMLHLPA